MKHDTATDGMYVIYSFINIYNSRRLRLDFLSHLKMPLDFLAIYPKINEINPRIKAAPIYIIGTSRVDI